MNNKSIWNTFIETEDLPTLKKEITADVVVIGGGITGLTSALLLSKEGFNVALIEGNKIGSGTTTNSTGNLYCVIDKNLKTIKEKYNLKTVKDILSARKEAISLIESNINTYGIDCDFEYVPWNLYSATTETNHLIEESFITGLEAGLEFNKVTLDKCPYPVKAAISLSDQAQFQPAKYVQGLLRSLKGKCSVYENSPAIEIKEGKDQSIIFTPSGKINCKYIIHASHTPKGVMMVQTLLGPYREYGVAFKLKYPTHPKGIFWGYYGNEEHISTRTCLHKGETYLMVMGAAHKVGQAKSNLEQINKLINFAREHFEFDEVRYTWAGQHYRPADLLPYIGRVHHSNTFVATGMSTDGLTWGTAAAMIISDQIMNRPNIYEKTFDYNRFTPLKSAHNFLKENLNVAACYLKDVPGSAEAKSFDQVKQDDGKIMELDGQKLAVHRDHNNDLHVCSAVCTHLACVVQWNDAEKSWDCPCHGSRFDTKGSILEGPATLNLDSVIIEGKNVYLRDSTWTSSQ